MWFDAPESRWATKRFPPVAFPWQEQMWREVAFKSMIALFNLTLDQLPCWCLLGGGSESELESGLDSESELLSITFFFAFFALCFFPFSFPCFSFSLAQQFSVA